MDIWVASSNKGKISEFQLLLGEQFQFHLQSEIRAFSQPPENGKTYLENARLKARSLKAVKPGEWILADDSGLEVEGLNQLPGVHTAVYAGPRATASENIAKLLKMMTIRNVTNRKAKFVATLVVYTPKGEEWVFVGEMPGTIAPKATGQMGFGYDPIFIPEGQSQSLAEIGPGFKNSHSHRSVAARAFLAKLDEYRKAEATP